MADKLLSDEYPYAKNWFDQFRIATGNIEPETLQQTAIKSKCNILYEKRCYNADGSVHEIHHEFSADALKKFLCDWKECAKERDINIEWQHQLNTLDEQMAAQNKVLANLEAQHSKIRFQLR